MKVILYGASGHGWVVADIVSRLKDVEVAGFVDDDASKTGEALGRYRVVGPAEVLADLLAQGVEHAIVTVGRNAARTMQAKRVTALGYRLMSAVHPSATMAAGVEVGAGSVVMAGAVANSGCSIGSNVILNTGATIDHECVLEDGCHVSPGVHLAGNVHVGAEAHLGIGAAVIQGVRIGDHAVVGAGAIVLKDVPPGETWAGNPACPIRSSRQDPDGRE